MAAEQPGPIGHQIAAWIDEVLADQQADEVPPLVLTDWQRDLLDLTYERWIKQEEDHVRFRELIRLHHRLAPMPAPADVLRVVVNGC